MWHLAPGLTAAPAPLFSGLPLGGGHKTRPPSRESLTLGRPIGSRQDLAATDKPQSLSPKEETGPLTAATTQRPPQYAVGLAVWSPSACQGGRRVLWPMFVCKSVPCKCARGKNNPTTTTSHRRNRRRCKSDSSQGPHLQNVNPSVIYVKNPPCQRFLPPSPPSSPLQCRACRAPPNQQAPKIFNHAPPTHQDGIRQKCPTDKTESSPRQKQRIARPIRWSLLMSSCICRAPFLPSTPQRQTLKSRGMGATLIVINSAKGEEPCHTANMAKDK